MLLQAHPLIDVSSVNSFEVTDTATWTEGSQFTFYFQLIDASLDLSIKGFYPSGRRYMPPSGSTLSVQIQNINNAKVINRLAIQPFPEDASIWAINMLPTDAIHGSPQILLTLTEPGAVVTKGLVKDMVKIQSLNNSGC